MPLSVMVFSCLFYSVVLSYMAIRVKQKGDDRYMMSAEVSFLKMSLLVGDRSQTSRSSPSVSPLCFAED